MKVREIHYPIPPHDYILHLDHFDKANLHDVVQAILDHPKKGYKAGLEPRHMIWLGALLRDLVMPDIEEG